MFCVCCRLFEFSRSTVVPCIKKQLGAVGGGGGLTPWLLIFNELAHITFNKLNELTHVTLMHMHT